MNTFCFADPSERDVVTSSCTLKRSAGEVRARMDPSVDRAETVSLTVSAICVFFTPNSYVSSNCGTFLRVFRSRARRERRVSAMTRATTKERSRKLAKRTTKNQSKFDTLAVMSRIVFDCLLRCYFSSFPRAELKDSRSTMVRVMKRPEFSSKGKGREAHP